MGRIVLLISILIGSFILIVNKVKCYSNLELLEKQKPGKKLYEGHKVIRAFPKTKADIDFLNSLEDNPDIEVDFWARSRDIDIRVGPEDYHKLDAYLRRWNINYNIMNNNLQKSFEEEEKGHYRHCHTWHDDFHDYDGIKEQINNFNISSPTRTKIVNIGKSYEKKEIRGLEISDGKKQANKQKVVVICGQHAREWISPATCMYIMDNLINKYGKINYENITRMVDRFDWVFFPVMNPDGYIYSWVKDRMWRKNRQPNKNCHGTDLNRNWNYHFGGAGSSSNPCSDIYRGVAAFSAPEVLALAEYIKSSRNEIFAFIDVHSYSQLLMFPWSYTREVAPHHSELHSVSVKAANALYSVHGTRFKTGPAAVAIYQASGSAKDWVFGSMGVRYAFVFELRDRGKHGFLLPKKQIIPTAEETLAAFHSLSINMKDYDSKTTIH